MIQASILLLPDDAKARAGAWNTLKINIIYPSSSLTKADFAYGGQGAQRYVPKCAILTQAPTLAILDFAHGS